MTLRIAAILAAIAFAALAAPVEAGAQVQLVDQTGRHFAWSSLRGTPTVVTFVAAHCTEACPLVNAQFAQAASLLAHDRTNVRLLTVTLDPEHDPPAVMRVLARRFGADPKTWLVASGSVPAVHGIMALFGVVAQQGTDGYAEMHSTFVYFVDRNGRLRETILASTNLGAQIVERARRDFPHAGSR